MPMFAPKPDNEIARALAVMQHDVLDTTVDPQFDDLVGLAAELCGTPIALVSFIGDDTQFLKARVGINVCSTARDLAFCAHAIMREELFVVPDALADERFRDNPLVTGEPHIRFYAGMPVIDEDGFALGTLCVIDRMPRRLTDNQAKCLQSLGRQVATHLQLRRLLKLHGTKAPALKQAA